MIVVRMIKFGLCNQLFTYAFARYLSESFGEEIYVYFPRKMDHGSTYENGLKRLGINLRVIKNKIDLTRLSKGKNIYHLWLMVKYGFKEKKKVNLFLEEEKGEVLVNKGIILNYSPDSSFDNIAELNIKGDIYVRGYFQTTKYANHIREILSKEIAFSKEEKMCFSDIIENMKKTESVCLHIRRGDYLLHPKFVVCNDEYYMNAIEVIKNKIYNPTFFVFSDDIDYVKEHIFWFDKSDVVFVSDEIHRGSCAADELRLMHYCKHYIISNSSFSWWGQFLSHNEEKIVISPSRWYNGEQSKKLLIDDKWICIGEESCG